MATFSITGIQLDPDNQFITTFIANEAILAGDLVFVDTDGEVNKAVNTDSAKDDVVGIAIQDADPLNQCAIVTQGAIQVSNSLVIGDSFILSATLGDLMLATDILSTQFLTWFGAATKTDEITISLKTFSVAKA